MKSQIDCEVSPDSSPARPLRVLVVDDDLDTATSTALLLQIYGYQVEVATAGPTALEIAQTALPDVVLLDLAMPGMDGWQVAAQLRQQRLSKKRPMVIAVSGYGETASRIRSYEVGIDLHLVKPVCVDELQRILTKAQTVGMRSADAKARADATISKT